DKGVMHRGQALLAVEHDAVRPRRALETVNRLTREGGKRLLLASPEQQAANVVVQEDRPYEIANIPGVPLELALEVGDDVPAFTQPTYQRSQIGVIGVLSALHRERSHMRRGCAGHGSGASDLRDPREPV